MQKLRWTEIRIGGRDEGNVATSSSGGQCTQTATDDFLQGFFQYCFMFKLILQVINTQLVGPGPSSLSLTHTHTHTHTKLPN